MCNVINFQGIIQNDVPVQRISIEGREVSMIESIVTLDVAPSQNWINRFLQYRVHFQNVYISSTQIELEGILIRMFSYPAHSDLDRLQDMIIEMINWTNEELR